MIWLHDLRHIINNVVEVVVLLAGTTAYTAPWWLFQAGIIEEMMEDTMEDMMDDNEELEEEAQEEVDKVLWEITQGKTSPGCAKVVLTASIFLSCAKHRRPAFDWAAFKVSWYYWQ